MQPTVVSYGTKLYVFGGLNSTSGATLNQVYVYDTAAAVKTWTPLGLMPVATAYAAGTQNGASRIWVMGGSTGSYSGYAQRTVQEFNPATGAWTLRRHLTRPRAGAAGINNSTKVFCLHGSPAHYNDSDKYADGEWYNPTVGYWMPTILMSPYNPIIPRPPGLYTPGVGQYSTKIFLLGGVTNQSSYSPAYSHNVWVFTRP